MPRSSPVRVQVPRDGVTFAESVHAADFAMAERRDPFHKLLYVPSGRAALRWKEAGQPTSHEGGPGSLWILPAHIPHSLVDLEPSTVFLLCLGSQFALEPPLSSLLARPAGPLPLPRDTENLWRRALLEGVGHPPAWPATQHALALLILIAAARLGSAFPTGPRDRLRQLIRTVSETLYEPWSIDRAASAVALSRRQFTKLFRAETGKSFLEYLTDSRLAYVEDLLRSGRSTVTGAVFSAGFDDLSHFYRLFRRRTGLSPRAWLRASRPR